MSEAKLIVSGPEGYYKEVVLNPEGVSIGRVAECDVVLDVDNVSRRHARMFKDNGSWVIEDCNSHNGLLINGKRVKEQAVSPGQKIQISHFTLSVADEFERPTITGLTTGAPISVVDLGLEEDIVSYRAEESAILSPALMHHLNEFAGRLMKLTDPAELYEQACDSLSRILNTLVAVVRLPAKPAAIPACPEILAYQFRGGSDAEDVHFSKRVLEAVRKTDSPVKATSGSSDGEQLALTMSEDEQFKPHVVFSACVNESEGHVDALYLDILEERSSRGMFDFMEAIARQLNFVQKNLFLTELKKQEKAVREANIKLTEKDRIKDEYVSRVTHDIKGHLAAIQSCLFVAGMDPDKNYSEKQSEFLGRAQDRTGELTDFVKELLNLTRMRLSGHVDKAKFSLRETISKSLTTVAGKAKDKSITLTSNVGATVGDIMGEEFSINEMITNLLFNAIKYTPEDKSVHLEADKNGEYIQIDVVDTGIGIPAGEVEKVFEEFFRASNAKTSGKEGTGLGLSLVKQIIDRHGGKISVQSEAGKGSTFTVLLPA